MLDGSCRLPLGIAKELKIQDNLEQYRDLPSPGSNHVFDGGRFARCYVRLVERTRSYAFFVIVLVSRQVAFTTDLSDICLDLVLTGRCLEASKEWEVYTTELECVARLSRAKNFHRVGRSGRLG